MYPQPTIPLLPAVCLSTQHTIEAAKYRGELVDCDWPPLPYPGVTSYLLSIPAKTKPLPKLVSAVWSWQPFGPDEKIMSFMVPGAHYRGFPVIKVTDEQKQQIERGERFTFTYKREKYEVIGGKVEKVVKTTLTHAETGAAGILVSFKELSVQATDDNLAEAIKAVAPRYATIEGYQGAREIVDTRELNDTTYFAFKLLPGSNAVTWFKAAKCSELRRAS